MAKKGRLKGAKKDKEAKIIVVDDSEYTRKVIVTALEEANFKVIGEADSAEKGIQIAHSTDANLYLIDIVMPEINGLELAKHLQEKQEDIQIIMMGAIDSEEMILEAMGHGASDFLRKPVEPNDLIKAVSRLAKRIKEGDM